MTDSTAGDFAHDGRQFGISGRFNVPRSPQGHPVIFQAGDSPTGREFAAADADCIFTRHGTIEAGQRFYQDVKGRLARDGRDAEELKVLPAATFVLGDTEAEALERCAVIRRQQVSGPTAILFLEQVWNRDLSGYDPDGPLPDSEPDLVNPDIAEGRVSAFGDRIETAGRWRALAEAKSLSIRELMIEVTAPASFVGTPSRWQARSKRRLRCVPPTDSSLCRTSHRGDSTSSPTPSCPSYRNGIASAPTTTTRHCAII